MNVTWKNWEQLIVLRLQFEFIYEFFFQKKNIILGDILFPKIELLKNWFFFLIIAWIIFDQSHKNAKFSAANELISRRKLRLI